MKLNDCGCCGADDAAASEIWNPPGLSEIGYRIDRFDGFKRRMHEALNRESTLGRLTTREDSDPTLAVIDAWAVVLDVLTFYQERIANESYLRTSTEYRSVYELGREVGYRLAPGTAATAYLAFKVDGPDGVRIDPGTKVQSQPGQDELPQIYETLEAVVARPLYNAIPVRRFTEDALTAGRDGAFFEGTTFDAKVGDALLFVASDTVATPSNDRHASARVTAVRRDDGRRVTWLEWSPSLPDDLVLYAFLMRQKAAVFGYNAIDYDALPVSLRIGEVNPKDPDSFIDGPFAGMDDSWADAALNGKIVDLDGLYPHIALGSWIWLSNGESASVFRVDGVEEAVVDRFMMSGKVTRLTLDREGLSSFNPKTTAVLAQSEPLRLAKTPIRTPLMGDVLEFDDPAPSFEKGRRLLVVGKRPRVRFLRGGALRDGDGSVIAKVSPDDECWLDVAPDGPSFRVTTPDGLTGTVQSDPSLIAYLPARADDLATVGEMVVAPLSHRLRFAYDRASTVVYGNVAFASHGETQREVLGSGFASTAFQQFELKHAPLTYLAAATETGFASSLQVRVNDVRWHETPTLLDDGPNDRVYTARENDQQATVVQIGNGATGARLPTGVENVLATYRKGSGLAGRVRAGQLSMLLTRPLGLTGVTNPLPAEGGSNPESGADARANIPRFALTLGRIVSVQDFEDHASRFPGVAKAQARLIWAGDHQVVVLTVSGPEGEPIDTTNLVGSIDSVRDTHFPLVVVNVETVRFSVRIDLLVRDDYPSESVRMAVSTRLKEAFGFERRQFAEAVTASQLLAEVQGVEGVEAANVRVLDFAGGAGDLDMLRAKPARAQGGVLLPAQILLVAGDQIEIGEMPHDL